MSGWIGVDLDGTLAHHDGWKGIEHVGEPVPLMMERVKEWIHKGRTVKIFTARVSVPDDMLESVTTPIHDWCQKHGLPKLEITCKKDFGMIELWDDRCRQVEMNTGRVIE